MQQEQEEIKQSHEHMVPKTVYDIVTEQPIGEIVTIRGWGRTFRKVAAGQKVMVPLFDGSSRPDLQLVFDRDVVEGFDELLTCARCTSITVTGLIIESPGKGQAVEMQVHSFVIHGHVDGSTFPLPKKGVKMETLRQLQHWRWMTPAHQSIARARHACQMSTFQYYDQLGYVHAATPLISGEDCEGAGEQFQVTVPGRQPDDHFFGRQAGLTVSGQLQGEAMCHGMSKIFTFGPTFRAEDSHTSRHLSEFWMCEPEVAHITLSELMDLVEGHVKYCAQYLLERYPQDMEFFDQQSPSLIDRLQTMIATPFARITYTEAIDVLLQDVASGKVEFEKAVEWGMDMDSEHEKYLCEQVYGKPTFVTHYPAAIKSFYMKVSDEDERVVEATDLLVPGVGELVGGSIREHRLEILEPKCPAGLDWYLDLRRYGGIPTGGFGIGFERLIMYLTGWSSIRDVIPFPRYPGRI